MRSTKHVLVLASTATVIAFSLLLRVNGQNGNAVGDNAKFTIIQCPGDGVVHLQWQSDSNGFYRIDYAPGLTGLNGWNTLYTNLPSQGATTLWTDIGNPNRTPPINFPGDDPQRFYRVVQTATNDLSKAPQVTLISPTNAATLSGVVPATVSIANPQNVSRIRLFVDGVETGNHPSDTDFTLNTCRFGNGSHMVFAAADDFNLNSGISSLETVSFSNLVQNFYGKVVFTNSPTGVTNEYRANFGGCANWIFTVTNQAGFAVRTIVGSSQTMKLFWNGTDNNGFALPNGPYGVTLTATPSAGACSGGANWYVRPNATGYGTGTDWNNAWHNYTNVNITTDSNNVPLATNYTPLININWSDVKPGDTIWIAGGNYAQLFLGTSGASGQQIYIKRARSVDFIPSNTIGWSSNYDSTPVINQVSCHDQGLGNYITIDGQNPYGGIIITNTTVDETYIVDLNGSGASYVELLNLDIGGVATLSTIFTGEGRCFSTTTPAEGLHVAYCRLHGNPTLVLTGNQEGMVWEHNFFYDNVVGNPADWHPNLWNSVGTDNNCIFRYNEASNYMVEGIMFSTDSANTNWQIYGNFFHDGTPGQVSRILEAQSTAHGPVLLFNNTFVNLATGVRVANDGSWTNSQSYNNLFIKAGDPLAYGFGNGADDYILADTAVLGLHSIGFASTSIFVNYAAGNYNIVTNIGLGFPRNAGVTLDPQYDRDFNGNLRGADGVWDIGAFEVQGP